MSKFWPLIFNPISFFHPTEPPGAFLEAVELCSPVWHIQSLLPRRTMWTVLQSLQQGTVYITSLYKRHGVSYVGIKHMPKTSIRAALKELNRLN